MKDTFRTALVGMISGFIGASAAIAVAAPAIVSEVACNKFVLKNDKGKDVFVISCDEFGQPSMSMSSAEEQPLVKMAVSKAGPSLQMKSTDDKSEIKMTIADSTDNHKRTCKLEMDNGFKSQAIVCATQQESSCSVVSADASVAGVVAENNRAMCLSKSADNMSSLVTTDKNCGVMAIGSTPRLVAQTKDGFTGYIAHDGLSFLDINKNLTLCTFAAKDIVYEKTRETGKSAQ